MRRRRPRCPAAARRGRGLALLELLIAAAVGALLLAGLTSVARLAVLARAQTRDRSEAVYQVRFALQRVVAAARATPPRALLPVAPQTSGDWFAPTYFCVNASSALIETTTADTGCSGSRVIAERVSSFSVALPAGAGALDAVSAVIAISASGPGGGAAISLAERVRLGGGLQ